MTWTRTWRASPSAPGTPCSPRPAIAHGGNEEARLIRPDECDAQTDSGDGLQFTYDAQGRVLTVLSPDGQVFQGNTCNTKDIMMPVA